MDYINTDRSEMGFYFAVQRARHSQPVDRNSCQCAALCLRRNESFFFFFFCVKSKVQRRLVGQRLRGTHTSSLVHGARGRGMCIGNTKEKADERSEAGRVYGRGGIVETGSALSPRALSSFSRALIISGCG